MSTAVQRRCRNEGISISAPCITPECGPSSPEQREARAVSKAPAPGNTKMIPNPRVYLFNCLLDAVTHDVKIIKGARGSAGDDDRLELTGEIFAKHLNEQLDLIQVRLDLVQATKKNLDKLVLDATPSTRQLLALSTKMVNAIPFGAR